MVLAFLSCPPPAAPRYRRLPRRGRARPEGRSPWTLRRAAALPPQGEDAPLPKASFTHRQSEEERGDRLFWRAQGGRAVRGSPPLPFLFPAPVSASLGWAGPGPGRPAPPRPCGAGGRSPPPPSTFRPSPVPRCRGKSSAPPAAGGRDPTLPLRSLTAFSFSGGSGPARAENSRRRCRWAGSSAVEGPRQPPPPNAAPLWLGAVGGASARQCEPRCIENPGKRRPRPSAAGELPRGVKGVIYRR